jgi:predicted transcriptional regulator of viral defense system
VGISGPSTWESSSPGERQLVDSAEPPPIHVTVPGSPDDPREPFNAPPGVVLHHSPHLHPEDVAMVDGIPCTSVARTLVDCAEEMTKDELREVFANADRKGLLDIDAVRRSAARVEWRPSLQMLYEVIDEFGS